MIKKIYYYIDKQKNNIVYLTPEKNTATSIGRR